MPWSTIATNQCVSLNNLRDAIANGIFIAISSVPSGTKQITKTEALAYVDIQTSPLASKSSNQLVVKSNLTAKIYTYDRYDVDVPTCNTSNPIPHWSYFDLPTSNYNINGLPYLYQLRPSTHTNYTNQITSYVTTTCTPVTRYTYQTSDVNPTTCALSNTIQWWSYNNYANGLYYINGPGTLYSLSASSHTNYSNQITSVSIGSCGTAPTIYYYEYYHIDQNTCQYDSAVGYAWSYASVANGYYFRNYDTNNVYYFISKPSGSQTFEITNFQSTTCTPNPCKEYVFHNSNPLGNGASETFSYTNCSTGSTTNITVASLGYAYGCVKGGTTPPPGSLGDVPYTLGFTC
jgi:hypothetical protein